MIELLEFIDIIYCYDRLMQNARVPKK